MTPVVVLDVNILASAAAVPDSIPAFLVDEGFKGRYIIVLSDPMIRKLEEVLKRPYFARKLGQSQREAVAKRTRVSADLVTWDASVSGICDDEEDDIVLGTAVAAGADYLVTGDHGLLAIGSYGEIQIITAREFLAILNGE